MLKIIIRRLIVSIPLVLGITLISFLIIQAAPGDYLSALKMNPQISPETVERLRKSFGLDQPVLLQYFHWLWRVLHLDLGISFAYRAPVADLIASRAFNTFLLSLASICVTWSLAFIIGIFTAWRKNKPEDKILMGASYLFMYTPGFLIAFLLLFAASRSAYFPLGGTYSPEYFFMSVPQKIIDRLYHLVLPVIAMSVPSASYLFRLVRSNFLEFINETFVTAARAKGLSERRVILLHVMRNALNPFITLLGFEFATVLSGAALIEIILNLQGLGTLLLKAVLAQDLYLIMGSVLMGSVLLVIGNMFADAALAVVDPRVRVE